MRTETDALLSLQRHVAAALPDFTEILTEVEHEQPPRPYAVVSANGDRSTSGLLDLPWDVLPCTVYAYVKGATAALARKAAEDAREALWFALVGPGGRRRVPLWDYTGRPEVQRLVITGAASGTWQVETEEGVSVPLDARAQPLDVRVALEQLVAGDGPIVFGRAGGPWDVRFDGPMRGLPRELMELDTSQLVPAPAQEIGSSVERLSAGSPDPWRSARDFVNVEQIQLGGLRDPDDPTLRTATASVRLTWGRDGAVPSADMTLTGITARTS